MQEQPLVLIEDFISKINVIATYNQDPEAAAEYAATRKVLMDDPFFAPMLPKFVMKSRTAADLRRFCQEIGGYGLRRKFIEEQFESVRIRLETAAVAPADDDISNLLKNFDADNVARLWKKSIDRRADDPDGAVTAARTLLETVCKHILDIRDEPYKDGADLPVLFSVVAKVLTISPSQQTDGDFRAMCQGCFTVIKSLGALRNRASDSHGRGAGITGPEQTHAALVVNLAGAMAAFLIETHASQPAPSAGTGPTAF